MTTRIENLIAAASLRYLTISKALETSYTNDATLNYVHTHLGREWEQLSKDPKIAAWKPLMELILSDIHKPDEEHPETETISNANCDYKNAPTANKLWGIFLKTIKDPSIDLNRLTLSTLSPCIAQTLSQKKQSRCRICHS